MAIHFLGPYRGYGLEGLCGASVQGAANDAWWVSQDPLDLDGAPDCEACILLKFQIEGEKHDNP